MAVLASTIIVPHGYQSICHKIRGGFSYMKGSEFEIWTLFYSPYVLKFMIVSDRNTSGFKKAHYTNWMLFVKACQLIVQPSISLTQAAESRELLRSFCTEYAELFGTESIKPNFHYSLHLYDNVKQFGSSLNTSCFSLERMNGALKNSTENKNITSIQHTYMTNFLESIHAASLVKTIGEGILSTEQINILENTAFSTTSYELIDHQARIDFYKLSSFEYTSHGGAVTGAEALYYNPKNISTNFSKIKTTEMNTEHFPFLIEYYSACYPNHFFTATFHLSNYSSSTMSTAPHYVSNNIKISKTFQSDVVYSSRLARSLKGAYIQTFFIGSQINDPVASYYGEIQYFFQHSLALDRKHTVHHFAFVKWFRLHSSSIGGPDEKLLELCKGYEEIGMHSILPVHRIYSQVAVACTRDNTTNPRIPAGCIVIIPQQKKLFV